MPRSPKKKKKVSAQAGKDSTNPEVPSVALVGSTSVMVQRAIASGARHGIKILPGRVNPATGEEIRRSRRI